MYKKYLADPYMKAFYQESLMSQNPNKNNIPFIFELKGILNKNILRKAVIYLFSTWFKEIGGNFSKNKQGKIFINIPEKFKLIFDEKTINSNENLKLYVKQMVELPFDIINEPLYRFGLYNKNICNNKHIFIMHFHHSIYDENCVPYMINNLSNIYNAFLNKEDFILESSPSLSTWLKNNREIKNKHQKKIFWTEFLSGYDLHTPLNFNRGLKNSPIMAKKNFKLPDEVKKQFTKFCWKLKSTEFIVSGAIFGILLQKHITKKKFTIAYPISKHPSGKKNMPGCFVNTLPMKFSFYENLNFIKLVQSLNHQRKSVKDYSDYMTTDIIHDYRQNNKTSSNNNLLNIILSSSCLNHNMLGLEGIKCSGGLFGGDIFSNWYELNDDCDLSFIMDHRNGKTSFSIHYNKILLNNFMEDFEAVFLHILEQVIAFPKTLISSLQLLPSNKLIEYFDRGKGLEKKILSKSIIDDFESQVSISPSNCAVIDDDIKYNYLELNEFANNITYTLLGRKSTENKIIAICLPRGIELIAAILAVLKSGAAYLPLDPNAPEEHQKNIINQSGASLVITNKQLQKLFNFCSECFIDIKFSMTNNQTSKITIPQRKINSLAYVIYTSGSTGIPKGVMIEDKGICNLSQWYKNYFLLKKEDCGSQFASQAFDTFGCEIWPFLLNGASIGIIKEELKFDIKTLVHSLKRMAITICDLPTSLSNSFLTANLSELTKLRAVKFGGEKLYTLPNKVYNFSIINSYGPTEGTIEATFSNLYKAGRSSTSLLKINPAVIGRPIQNVSTYILDHNQHLLPVGVCGEIYLSGIGLMRGYHNVSSRDRIFEIELLPGKILSMYKTGDIGRLLIDNQIEYIGRNDKQVNIRGYRIELSSIENMLYNIKGVINAAAVIKQVDTNSILIGYIQLKVKSSINKIKIFEKLSKEFPSYWLPHKIIILNEIPLTVRGKVDYKKLNALPFQEENIDQRVMTKNEREIAIIWGSVLKEDIDILSPDLHFYSQGGSSLLLMELLIRLSDYFDINLTLYDLINANTIAKQAILIQNNLKKETKEWICFHYNKNKIPIILLPPRGAGQESYANFAKLFKGHSLYGIESHNLFCKKDENITSLELLAAQYIKILKQHIPNGTYKLAGWSLGGNIAQEMARQLEIQGDSVYGIYLLDAIVLDDYEVKLSEKLEPIIENILINSEKFSKLEEQAKKHLLQVKKIENKLYIEHSHKRCNAPCWLFKAKKYIYPTTYTSYEKEQIDKFYARMKMKKTNGWDVILNKIKIIPIDASHKNILEIPHAKKIAAICMRETINV